MANTHSIDLERSSSQALYITDNASLSITGDISIAAWINLETLPSVAGGNFAIVSKYRGSDNQRAYIFSLTSANKLEFYGTGNGAGSTALTALQTTASITSTGTWYHVAATVDVSAGASGITYYVNGSVVTDTDGTNTATSIADSTASFAIGAENDTNATTFATFFDGLIDEVVVTADILSASEILSLYTGSTPAEAGIDNIAGYWNLNNDLNDSSGNSNTLTNSNSAVFSTTVPSVGTNTSSLSLIRASSQYASIADASQTGLDLNSDFTIEAWVKLSQLPSSVTSTFSILTKRASLTTEAYDFHITSADKLRIILSNDGTTNNGNRTLVVTDSAVFTAGDVGNWVHIAVTVDLSAPTATFYKNGSSVASTVSLNSATSIYNSSSAVRLGANATTGTADLFFDGLIDEVAVYDTILSPADILANTTDKSLRSNLIAYWKLNSNYTDSSTNSNTLTASGNPAFSTSIPFANYSTGAKPRVIFF